MRSIIINSADVATISRYLPTNYQAVDMGDGRTMVVGSDHRGWTLDDYVIPRLASGGYYHVPSAPMHDHIVASTNGCEWDDCPLAVCEQCTGRGCQSCGQTGHALDGETGEPYLHVSEDGEDDDEPVAVTVFTGLPVSVSYTKDGIVAVWVDLSEVSDAADEQDANVTIDGEQVDYRDDAVPAVPDNLPSGLSWDVDNGMSWDGE